MVRLGDGERPSSALPVIAKTGFYHTFRVPSSAKLKMNLGNIQMRSVAFNQKTLLLRYLVDLLAVGIPLRLT